MINRKTFLAIGLLLLFLVPVQAQRSEIMLKGSGPFQLITGVSGGDYEDSDNAIKNAVKDTVELELRRSGIPVLGGPVAPGNFDRTHFGVQVYIMKLESNDGTSYGPCYSLGTNPW